MAEKGGVQSVERIFQLIEHLAAHPTGVSLQRLAGETELAKSTVHRLLASQAVGRRAGLCLNISRRFMAQFKRTATRRYTQGDKEQDYDESRETHVWLLG